MDFTMEKRAYRGDIPMNDSYRWDIDGTEWVYQKLVDGLKVGGSIARCCPS